MCPICNGLCRYKMPRVQTALGAVIAPTSRLARRYAYLHERGIGLADWSTDAQVSAVRARLVLAVAQAPADLRADLESVLGRVPEARAR